MGDEVKKLNIGNYVTTQNDIATKEKAAAEKAAADIKAVNDANIEAKKQQAQALSDAGKAMIQSTADANQVIEDTYTDAAKQLGEDLTAARTEDSILRKADARSSQILAATEAAAAIANLIGVGGFNAVNQTITPQYSQDWMRRADAAHQQRKTRIENIRERQRAAEDRLAILKGRNAKDLAGLKYKQAVTDAGQSGAIKDAETKAALDQIKANYGAGAAERIANAATNKQATEWMIRQQQADRDYNLRWTAYNNRGGGSNTKSGGFNITLGSDGTHPPVRLTFGNEKSVINTMLANRAKVQMDDKDRKLLEDMARVGIVKPDDLSAILMRYIGSSPELRQLIIGAADGVYELTDPNAPADTDDSGTSQPTGQWQPTGFLWGGYGQPTQYNDEPVTQPKETQKAAKAPKIDAQWNPNAYLWDGRSGQEPPVEYTKPAKPQQEQKPKKSEQNKTKKSEQKKPNEGLKSYH